MKSRYIAIAAIVLAALVPVAAPAYISKVVTINNQSNGCAWVTLYGSSGKLSPYKILNEPPYITPQFVRSGESVTFKLFEDYKISELKVRAEIKRNGNCTGDNKADIEDYRKDLEWTTHMTARIWNTVNGYHITF